MTPTEPRPAHSEPSVLAPLFGVALALSMIVAVGVYALSGGADPWGDCHEQDPPAGDANEWRKWDPPLVALALTGQMHGYVDPCGCSHPQYGGLVRRYNFVQSLIAGSSTKDKKPWNVVGIDLGEIAPVKGIPEQNLLKFRLSIQSLAKMNYRAVGIGANEILLPLGEGLAFIWDKKQPHPRPINLSLDGLNKGGVLNELNAYRYEIVKGDHPTVGIIGMMGPDVRNKLAPQQAFVQNLVELPKALDEFGKQGVKIGVILHHEYPEVDEKKFPPGFLFDQEVEKQRRKQAEELAKFCDEYRRKKNPKAPPIHLMMLLTNTSEPGMFTKKLDGVPTEIVEIGHKGKYVGLVGVHAGAKKGEHRLQYQPVLMSPDLDPTEKDKAGHPIIALFEQYTLDLKRQDMLAKVPRSLHFNQIPTDQKGLKATFVGSSRCGECHTSAHEIWEKTAHAKATKTLENLKHPSNRQFDPECMRCHTVGLQHPGGYNDFVPNLANWPQKPVPPVAAGRLAKHNQELRGVGCESCHGPGSEHVKNPENKDLYNLINPFAPTPAERNLENVAKRTAEQENENQKLLQRRMLGLNTFCSKCHDDENDVHWGKPGHTIADKWIGKKLIHRTPKNNNGGALEPMPKKADGPTNVASPPTAPPEIVEDKKKP